jgi:hypothetical protein
MNLARTGPGMTLPLFYEPANVNHCESPPWVISGNRWLARVRPLFPPKQTRGVDRRAVRPIFGPREARVFHLLHAGGLAAPS